MSNYGKGQWDHENARQQRIAELEAENARLKERMDVVLHAGPATSIAVHAFDRCVKLERERDEARALTESWKSQVLDRETMLNEARAACAAMRRAIEPVLHCACSSCVDRLSEALSSTAGSELLARLEKAEAELAKLKAPKPEPKWCDICPHPLGLHNDDGSCGCGMDCQRERALKSKGGGA